MSYIEETSIQYGSNYSTIRQGSDNDAMDCSVVSLAVVTGIPYAEASAKLASAGRKRNGRFSGKTTRNVIRKMHFTVTKIDMRSKTVRTIERELAAQYGDANVLVYTRGHVLAWDGREIVDWTAGRQQRILSAYLVYPGSTQPEFKSVPAPPQKATKKTSRPISAVEAKIADGEWIHYRSVKAAYDANGLNLSRHQKVRRYVKHFGYCSILAWSSQWEGQVRFRIRLADMSKAVDPQYNYAD